MSVRANRAFAGQEVDTLRAALDEVELGVILLDSDLNVQFVNRAFLQIYRLAEKSVVLGLGFEGLMRLVVGRTRKISAARFNAYVKSRATSRQKARSSSSPAAGTMVSTRGRPATPIETERQLPASVRAQPTGPMA